LQRIHFFPPIKLPPANKILKWNRTIVNQLLLFESLNFADGTRHTFVPMLFQLSYNLPKQTGGNRTHDTWVGKRFAVSAFMFFTLTFLFFTITENLVRK